MAISRLKKLRASLAPNGIEAMVISSPANCRYLSGFTGTTASLMIDANGAYIYTDFRYLAQARTQCPDFKVVQIGGDYHQKLLYHLNQANISRVGFEAHHLTYGAYQELTTALRGLQLVPVQGMLEKLRTIKDQEEIKLLEKAVAIADEGWQQITRWFKTGVTEMDLALELEFAMRRLGAEGRAFDFIVASGVRGALPHGVASDKQITPGDLVTVDFGALYQGYHSDITRNFVVGAPTKKHQTIYNIVLEAQLTALEAVQPGIPASVVDLAARNVIERYGYAEFFGHGTGHGVGLAIHEEPKISFQIETILQPGMFLTVEPGIYLPEWGGVRIEDLVLVTESGCRILTQTPKDLISLT